MAVEDGARCQGVVAERSERRWRRQLLLAAVHGKANATVADGAHPGPQRYMAAWSGAQRYMAVWSEEVHGGLVRRGTRRSGPVRKGTRRSGPLRRGTRRWCTSSRGRRSLMAVYGVAKATVVGDSSRRRCASMRRHQLLMVMYGAAKVIQQHNVPPRRPWGYWSEGWRRAYATLRCRRCSPWVRQGGHCFGEVAHV